MNINIISPINYLGYGVTGTNIVHALSKNYSVSLFPISNQVQLTDNCYAPSIWSSYKRGQSIDLDFEAPCIRIYHQNDMSHFVGYGPHIGFPIFELDEFNELEKHHLSSVERLFVCSEWAKEIIGANKISVPVHVVPLGVNRDIYKESPLPDGKFTFLNIGKWEIRKGHDIIPYAFRRAFENKKDVKLQMMCHNIFYTEDEIKSWHKLYRDELGNKVEFLPPVATSTEVASVMSQAHCGVFPARAEGWNLELLEMMSCGRQVIATNYAGHTQFCDDKNSILIETPHLEKAFDGKWFLGYGNWANLAEPEIDHLVECMRYAYENRQINQAGIYTAKHFTWDNTAKTIVSHLKELS